MAPISNDVALETLRLALRMASNAPEKTAAPDSGVHPPPDASNPDVMERPSVGNRLKAGALWLSASTPAQRLRLLAGTVAAGGATLAGVVMGGGGASTPKLPTEAPHLGLSVECVESHPNTVLSDTLPDGRTWTAVLAQGADAVATGEPLSAQTEAALCRVQREAGWVAVEDLGWTAAPEGSEPEVGAALEAHAASARLLAADDATDARIQPGLSRHALDAVLSSLASPETQGDPEQLLGHLAELLRLATQLERRAEVLSQQLPDREDASHQANVEGFQSLAQEARAAAVPLYAPLTLAANPTWTADHPGAQPPPELVTAVKEGLRAGTPFSDLRAQAEAAYRAQPGVAESHVVGFVSSLVSPESNLHPRALDVAAEAWRQGGSEQQIRVAVVSAVPEVADPYVKAFLDQQVYPRHAPVEDEYDRLVVALRPTWAQGASENQLKDAVRTFWDQNSPTPDFLTRVTYGGKTVDRFTAALLERAGVLSKWMGGPSSFQLNQGSFTSGEDRSVGTHSGAGAGDIRLEGSLEQQIIGLNAQHLAGIASWKRDSREDPHGRLFTGPHIHFVTPNPYTSAGAQRQMWMFVAGQSGLLVSNPGPNVDARDYGVTLQLPSWARALYS